jgi:predicted RNase H-like nuclease (RuvC/YqgF family)
MEQNDLSIISISDSDLKNVNAFCKLNNIDDVQKYIQYCFKKGYAIDKYGLINGKEPEVIEIEVERIVEKIIDKPCDETKIKMLEGTLQTLKKELSLRDEKINQLEEKVDHFKDVILSRGAVYHSGSNIKTI